MTTFGRYLGRRRVLSRGQLEEATQVMVVFGGRLGTVLVEAGLLGVDELEEHLAAHLSLPRAPHDRLARPDPEALRSVGRDLARRCGVLPMWLEKRRLHAAMLDPANPASVDAVAFASGLAVVPYVIAERRLVQLLERHYGIRPPSRFTDPGLLALAGHAAPAGPEVGGESEVGARTRGVGEPDDERPRWREAHGLLPLAEGEELCDVASFERAYTFAPAPAPTPAEAAPSDGAGIAPAHAADELADLEDALVMSADRDAVIPTALRAAAHHARVAAAFDVRDEMILGVLAAGEVPSGRVEGICVSASDPGMLGSASRGAVFHGSPSQRPSDAAVARALSGRVPREAAVLPIALDGRVVKLLYVDNGPDPLAPSALASLGALCDTVRSAYRRLISEQTRKLD